MNLVFALEETPKTIDSSIFLVGPTPRDMETQSWRGEMIKQLEEAGFKGTVFTPEPRGGGWSRDYNDQVNWEKKHLEMADVIIAWVPRELTKMPALTTNVEFGRYISSNKMLYGRPDNAEKCRYLDWMYEDFGFGKPFNQMKDIAEAAVKRIGVPESREGGELDVPLHIYRSPMFKSWLASQKAVGNKLESAKVLWEFNIVQKNFLFSYILRVNVWIKAEDRFKSNEFIFSRRDISTVMPFCRNYNLLDTKIVLVKEFRSPGRNSESFVYELPGGSTFKPNENASQVAASELKEETGLEINSDRIYPVFNRQLAATLSTHTSQLFAVELDEKEMALIEEMAAKNQAFGVLEDTERTYVVVKTIKQIMNEDLVDWSTIGMISSVVMDLDE